MFDRCRRHLATRRARRAAIIAEAVALIAIMQPSDAWTEARKRSLCDTDKSMFWLDVQREISLKTGYSP